MEDIKPGHIYIHIRSNEQYRIREVANEGAINPDYPIMVIYQRLSDNTVWTRRIDSFREAFTKAPCHHEYSIEKLYHFKCHHCSSWWTIGDFHKLNVTKLSCPNCGTLAEVTHTQTEQK